MPEVTGTRSRSWFTIEECPSPSTYRLFTTASWPRCGARSRRARLAQRGGRPWARSGSSFAASQACGLMATTFFSTTTRHSRARRYCATSVSRSRAHLKLRARCTRPKRQGARLPSPSTLPLDDACGKQVELDATRGVAGVGAPVDLHDNRHGAAGGAELLRDLGHQAALALVT